MKPIAGLLLILAVPILGAYFYLFTKTIKSLPESEQTRFVDEAGSKWSTIGIVALFVIFYYVENYHWKLATASAIVAFTIVSTYMHHNKLRRLNFDPKFERKLLRVSCLSGVGIVALLSSMVLNAHAT